jgi:signal transduction histidine kinase
VSRRKKFVEITTHEIRTPLTVIQRFIELLEKRDTKLSDEQRENCFKILNTNIERLNRLLNDVSDLSKLDRDVFSLSTEDIDITQFIAEQVQSYKHLLGDQIEFRISDALSFPILVNMEKYRIHQVLDNLINNAIKHTPKATLKISISIMAPSMYSVRIKVEDNGAGIKAENIETIFEPFVSFDSKYCQKGSGIGLFISRAFIEKMNGVLIASSLGEDQGSIFTIELPRVVI